MPARDWNAFQVSDAEEEDIMNTMNIGEVIRKYRQQRNMTQTELAACLNITPQAVSRWEMGISYPDITMLPGISEVLRVSADELLSIGPLAQAQRSGCASLWEHEEPCLNQSQADSVFDYVPAPSSGEGRRVLVVDDADFMRMILKNILTRCGHTVLAATNGQECLDLLQRERVDVCVLDIVMPVMDGIAALRRIREEHPGIRTIMLSAMSRESCVKQARQLGADAFVVKPFQEQCLTERIG